MDPDHVSELFAGFGAVSVRRMFGGFGIYAGGRMFGLAYDGLIYLKADAAAEVLAGRARHRFLAHDGAANLVGGGDRLAQRRTRQHDGEFFAAIARRDILALDVLLDRQGDEPEDLVAGQMAVGVVEALEMV